MGSHDFKAFCAECNREAEAVEARLRAAGIDDEYVIARAAGKAKCWQHRLTFVRRVRDAKRSDRNN